MFISLDKYFALINIAKPIYVVVLALLVLACGLCLVGSVRLGFDVGPKQTIARCFYSTEEVERLVQEGDGSSHSEASGLEETPTEGVGERLLQGNMKEQIRYNEANSETRDSKNETDSDRAQDKEFDQCQLQKNIKNSNSEKPETIHCKSQERQQLSRSKNRMFALQPKVCRPSLIVFGFILFFAFIMIICLIFSLSSSVFMSFCATFEITLSNESYSKPDHQIYKKMETFFNKIKLKKSRKFKQISQNLKYHLAQKSVLNTENNIFPNILVELDLALASFEQFHSFMKMDIENVDQLILDVNKQVACGLIYFVSNQAHCQSSFTKDNENKFISDSQTTQKRFQSSKTYRTPTNPKSHLKFPENQRLVKNTGLNKKCLVIDSKTIEDFVPPDCSLDQDLLLKRLNSILLFMDSDKAYISTFSDQLQDIKSGFISANQLLTDSLLPISAVESKMNRFLTLLETFYFTSQNEDFSYTSTSFIYLFDHFKYSYPLYISPFQLLQITPCKIREIYWTYIKL